MVGIEPLVAQLAGALSTTWVYLPYLIISIVILVIGLVIGKIVGRIIKEVLNRIKIDYYITEEKKPPISLASVFSAISRWYIYLVFIGMAFALTFPAPNGGFVYPELNSWIGNVFSYIPAVIGAAIILIAGFIIGEFIKNQLAKTGKPYSALTGKLILFFTMYVSIAIALPILFAPMATFQPIAYTQYMTLVTQILLVIIIAIAAAFALAVGLGGKDIVGKMMDKWAKRSKYI